MTSWDRFEAGLAEQLAELPAGALVVIETRVDTELGLAQFAQYEDKLVAELGAAGDLDEGAEPNMPGALLASAAGWHRPDQTDHYNWWVELPWPITTDIYRALAAMAVTGLRDVFHVSSPTRLVYRAWNSSLGNRDLDLPRLGIDRQ
ncbi:hypothetical protein ACFXHA_06860 [Nocardia sp. NPDC059240]|uniref:TY-Chap domain-containing protein n=1 Tax=Nocardia sp. NPDC059240 TaxID=3346786 RepID=UPI0036C12116